MAIRVTDRPMLNRVRHALEFCGLGSRVAPFPIRRQARPWSRAEVPAPPSGSWRAAAPDFVGIGTQKSGTSWWASLIEEHPDVVPNRFGRKEMHYLTHFVDRSMTREEVAAYHAAFARPAGKRCGEWTPNYVASPWTLLRLQEAAPEARVLVMVRNPVTRYESGLNHEFRNRFGAMVVPSIRRRVITGYALRKEAVWMGMYGAQLATALSVIPRDRVLVLQYERCTLDPAAMLARTYRFLGLDDGFRPAELDRQVNRQKRVVEPLADEGRGMLTAIYRDDVARLVGLFPDALDLSLWPEFADLQRAAPAGGGGASEQGRAETDRSTAWMASAASTA